jgi:hypothetical protein
MLWRTKLSPSYVWKLGMAWSAMEPMHLQSKHTLYTIKMSGPGKFVYRWPNQIESYMDGHGECLDFFDDAGSFHLE